MPASEQQKQIPVSVRDFRRPAGLPFPPLPGERRYAHEAGSFSGRQSGRLAGGLDCGGVAHASALTLPFSREAS